MITTAQTVLLLGIILVSWTDFLATKTESGSRIEYTADAQLKFPEHYREWVYLTAGFDMSYSPDAMQMNHHMFDNVFVNPEAYKVFAETGTWPDKTMFVLEVRSSAQRTTSSTRWPIPILALPAALSRRAASTRRA